MVKIICVRFRTAGKIYYFAPGEFDIKKGNHVIVETIRGVEFGTAVSDIMEIEEEKIVSPLKTVMRIASEEDEEKEKTNREKEREAFKICLEKIRKHELEMKLIDAEYTFDNNKLLFYFTADGRIDFRELVKDLASVFRTRIELRQIGVRDETKILGGYGICGRPLCCHTYLSDFSPVSIKMAKEQNLSLNPTKISGVCGRLMCCLQNEEETYEDLNRRLPGIGDIVTDSEGIVGEVQSVNVLRQRVKVIVEQGDEKEIREYHVDDITFQKRRKGPKEKPLMEEEISEEELRAITDEPEIKEKPARQERPERQNKQDRPEKGDKQKHFEKNGNSEKKHRDKDNRNNKDKNAQKEQGGNHGKDQAQKNFVKNKRKGNPNGKRPNGHHDKKDNNNNSNSNKTE
ncbi:MAG: stage 0 sporulation protein [Lachnospiraceae bacterium]|nr:stage 0 sporulation protein [Lachnospiraceae bacterium]